MLVVGAAPPVAVGLGAGQAGREPTSQTGRGGGESSPPACSSSAGGSSSRADEAPAGEEGGGEEGGGKASLVVDLRGRLADATPTPLSALLDIASHAPESARVLAACCSAGAACAPPAAAPAAAPQRAAPPGPAEPRADAAEDGLLACFAVGRRGGSALCPERGGAGGAASPVRTVGLRHPDCLAGCHASSTVAVVAVGSSAAATVLLLSAAPSGGVAPLHVSSPPALPPPSPSPSPAQVPSLRLLRSLSLADGLTLRGIALRPAGHPLLRGLWALAGRRAASSAFFAPAVAELRVARPAGSGDLASSRAAVSE